MGGEAVYRHELSADSDLNTVHLQRFGTFEHGSAAGAGRLVSHEHDEVDGIGQ